MSLLPLINIRCHPNIVLPCGEGMREGAVRIHHHFGNSLLPWRDTPIICGKSKLLLDSGRLHTGAIQNLALNLGCRDRLGAHRLNGELVAFPLRPSASCAQQNAAAQQKFLLCQGEASPDPKSENKATPVFASSIFMSDRRRLLSLILCL